jgi:hypothetical protein
VVRWDDFWSFGVFAGGGILEVTKAATVGLVVGTYCLGGLGGGLACCLNVIDSRVGFRLGLQKGAIPLPFYAHSSYGRGSMEALFRPTGPIAARHSYLFANLRSCCKLAH